MRQYFTIKKFFIRDTSTIWSDVSKEFGKTFCSAFYTPERNLQYRLNSKKIILFREISPAKYFEYLTLTRCVKAVFSFFLFTFFIFLPSSHFPTTIVFCKIYTPALQRYVPTCTRSPSLCLFSLIIVN